MKRLSYDLPRLTSGHVRQIAPSPPRSFSQMRPTAKKSLISYRLNGASPIRGMTHLAGVALRSALLTYFVTTPSGKRHCKRRFMMWRAKMRRGAMLRFYLLLTHFIPIFAGYVLRKRLKAGKEHQSRWIEKQGRGFMPRPYGRLIWINAVGLGEVHSSGRYCSAHG